MLTKQQQYQCLRQKNNNLWIVGWIKLDNPVDFWNVKTASSNICAQKNWFLGIAEMKERFCSLVLLLLALPTIKSLDNYRLISKMHDNNNNNLCQCQSFCQNLNQKWSSIWVQTSGCLTKIWVSATLLPKYSGFIPCWHQLLWKVLWKAAVSPYEKC